MKTRPCHNAFHIHPLLLGREQSKQMFLFLPKSYKLIVLFFFLIYWCIILKAQWVDPSVSWQFVQMIWLYFRMKTKVCPVFFSQLTSERKICELYVHFIWWKDYLIMTIWVLVQNMMKVKSSYLTALRLSVRPELANHFVETGLLIYLFLNHQLNNFKPTLCMGSATLQMATDEHFGYTGQHSLLLLSIFGEADIYMFLFCLFFSLHVHSRQVPTINWSTRLQWLRSAGFMIKLIIISRSFWSSRWANNWNHLW